MQRTADPKAKECARVIGYCGLEYGDRESSFSFTITSLIRDRLVSLVSVSGLRSALLSSADARLLLLFQGHRGSERGDSRYTVPYGIQNSLAGLTTHRAITDHLSSGATGGHGFLVLNARDVNKVQNYNRYSLFGSWSTWVTCGSLGSLAISPMRSHAAEATQGRAGVALSQLSDPACTVALHQSMNQCNAAVVSQMSR